MQTIAKSTRAVIALLLACISTATFASSSAVEAPPLCGRSSGVGDPTVRAVTLDGVQALLRIPSHVSKPPIVLWHGFGPPASEQAMMDALPLDDVEAVKVYLGLPMFGARAPAGGLKELARLQSEDVGLKVFKPVVAGAGNELPYVVAALQNGQCTPLDGPIDLVGFSAGGAAALYALAQHGVRIHAAVLINPSTGLTDSVQAYEHATKQAYTWSNASRQLARDTDVTNRAADIASSHPALLFLSGAADPVLDPANIATAYAKLKPYYAGEDTRLRWTAVPGMSHQWAADPSSLAEVRKATADWLRGSAPPPQSPHASP